MSKKRKKPAPTGPAPTVDAVVSEWVAKAPPLRGLRRPGTRMKAAALMQKLDASGFSTTPSDLGDVAEFVADIDELLAVLGGQAYIEWIEQVPLDGGVQVAVLLDLFIGQIYPELGKG